MSETDPLILIVDDEPQILRALKTILAANHFRVQAAATGEQALVLAAAQEPDIIILDLTLPDMDGTQVCEQIREWSAVPIIVLSVRDSEKDKVLALDKGADDYLTKPFSTPELRARVTSQIRRYTYLNSNYVNRQSIEAKGLSINEQNHTVSLYGDLIKLTPTEFSILLLLAKNKGKVFSSEEIYQAVWPNEKYYEGNNTVMAHMWRIREKIEVNPKEARIIETVWGVGYKIED